MLASARALLLLVATLASPSIVGEQCPEWDNSKWVQGGPPAADFTSASLLIDREGIVRYVHPGGLYAKDARDPRARGDYEELRSAILSLLGEGTR